MLLSGIAQSSAAERESGARRGGTPVIRPGSGRRSRPPGDRSDARGVSGSFFTLEPGTPVTDRFGRRVGAVRKVLIAYGEFFDGIVVATEAGHRFSTPPRCG